LKNPDSRGIYAFVIEGDVTIAGKELKRRDGMGVNETAEIEIKTNSQVKLLLMEVPMN